MGGFGEGEKFVVKITIEPQSEYSLTESECGRLRRHRGITRALLRDLGGREMGYFDATWYLGKLWVTGKHKQNDQKW